MIDHPIIPSNVESNSWFICYQPNPKVRLRLFCFPHGGGGASSFYTWAKELSSDIEIIGIQLPGYESRLKEPLITSVSLVVQILVDVIYPELNKPFAFFGHSLGTIISFELTRKLRQQYGIEPVHLFVSGKGAPQIPNSNLPIHNLTESAFLEELHSRYNGMPEEVLQNPEFLQLVLPGLRASLKMHESYNYISGDPLECDITAFGGLKDYTVSYENLEAWRYQTNRSFTLHMIPGNHFFIHFERKDFLKTLSKELTGILSRLK